MVIGSILIFYKEQKFFLKSKKTWIESDGISENFQKRMSFYSDRLQAFYILFIFIHLLTAQIENISTFFIYKNVINKISFLF